MKLLLIQIAVIFMPSVQCLYEDQIGKFDWTHRGVGSIKFADFDTTGTTDGSAAKIVIVATNLNVLASLNTKNGEILWRQVLEHGVNGAIDSLLVSKSQASIVTGNPPLLRSFDTSSSALVSEIQLQIPFKPPQSYGTRKVLQTVDSVILVHLTERTAEVSVFDKYSGELETKINSQQLWFSSESQCELSSVSLVCVEDSLSFLFMLPIKEDSTFTSVSLTSLGLVVNKVTDSDCQYLSPSVAVERVYGSNDHLTITSDGKTITVECTDKTVRKVLETGLGVSITEDDTLYTTSQESNKIQIFGYDMKSGNKISPTASLTLVYEQSILGSVLAEVKSIAIQKFERKGTGEEVMKALVTLEDDSVHLLASSGIVWTREESLSTVLAVEALDLPVHASSMSMHDQTNSRTIIASLIQRVVAQTTETLMYIADVLEGSLGSSGGLSDSAPILTRDEFNLHKLIIVATASGKILALDNWSGDIIWYSYSPQIRPLPSDKMLLFLQRTVAHFPLPPLMTLVGMQKDQNCNGIVYSFNPLTGEPVNEGVTLLSDKVTQASMLSQQDQLFIKPVIVVSPSMSVKVFPSVSGENVVLQNKDFIYITTRNSTHLSGHSLAYSEEGSLKLSPVWCGHFTPGKITAVYPKRTNDKLHSAGRVMADRSVLYKYTNPNLAVVVAQGYDLINKNIMSIYLVDLVSGAIIDWISHQKVSGPVHVMHSENWIVYTYHNDKLRRHELHSLELFEGTKQANATAFSSFSNIPQLPIVEKQAYILPQGVQAVTHTVTEKSITNKFLLMALQNGGIAQVARWLVDPRRPISNTGPREEGVMPYAPEIPMPPTEVISYNQSFPRVQGIFTGPTGLESTCVVFAYGLDLFFTRVFPSKMYDMLKDDFDYILIVGVLGLLFTAALVTKKLAQRKALYNLWK